MSEASAVHSPSVSPLRLGIMGMSPGNGHPYSWSAICNGYDPEAMKQCPFPTIPRYLAEHRSGRDHLPGVRVTHVWCDDRKVAEGVARACRIEHVVGDPTEMLGAVDGILLARDDAEHRIEHSAAFLQAGLPVYIDKPLALSAEAGREIFALEQYPGQIFTCSPVSYAFDYMVHDKGGLPECIAYVHGIVPKDWARYSMHVIEPTLKLVGKRGALKHVQSWAGGGVTVVNAAWESGLTATFTALGGCPVPISMRFVAKDGGISDLAFSDPFSAFKSALETFVQSVRSGTSKVDRTLVLEAVDIVEAGLCPTKDRVVPSARTTVTASPARRFVTSP